MCCTTCHHEFSLLFFGREELVFCTYIKKEKYSSMYGFEWHGSWIVAALPLWLPFPS